MRISNIEVYGIGASLRAMRNPKNSWDKSDSDIYTRSVIQGNNNIEGFCLGENDAALSRQLTKAGGEHCKHLRMVQVWFDMEAARYLWQEVDTYKHIEKISCSTVHKILDSELDVDDFEREDSSSDLVLVEVCKRINLYTNSVRKKELTVSKGLIRVKTILPESFLQLRTVNTNYQQLLNILKQRRNHPIKSWKPVCDMIEGLPYFKELTGYDK